MLHRHQKTHINQKSILRHNKGGRKEESGLVNCETQVCTTRTHLCTHIHTPMHIHPYSTCHTHTLTSPTHAPRHAHTNTHSSIRFGKAWPDAFLYDTVSCSALLPRINCQMQYNSPPPPPSPPEYSCVLWPTRVRGQWTGRHTTLHSSRAGPQMQMSYSAISSIEPILYTVPVN